MKRFARVSIALALVLATFLAMTIPASATELKIGIGIVETSGLRLRAAASTDSDILANAAYGDNVVIIRESGDFYLVDYNLQIGYMAKQYITFKDRENIDLGYGEVEDASVNMRSTPSSDGDLVAQLGTGDKAYIIGLNCGWYKVQYNGQTGYVRSDLLSLTQAPSTNSAGGSAAPSVSVGQQIEIMLICILGGIGTAGIPGATLPVIAMMLGMVGVPAHGLALVLGVDRVLDMCRTTVNVAGDLAIAVAVGGRTGVAPVAVPTADAEG